MGQNGTEWFKRQFGTSGHRVLIFSHLLFSNIGLGPKLNIRPIKLPVRTKPSLLDTSDDVNSHKSHKPSVHKKSSRPGNRPNNRNTSPKPDGKNNKRPRICQRLVVNCKSSPDHRCCLYEEKIENNIDELTTETIITTTSTGIP